MCKGILFSDNPLSTKRSTRTHLDKRIFASFNLEAAKITPHFVKNITAVRRH